MESDHFQHSPWGHFMQRLKIKTTLSAIFAVIGVTVAGFSAYSLHQLGKVNDTVGEVVTIWMPALEKVKDIEVRLGDVRTAYRQHLLMSDKAGKDGARNLMEQSVKTLNDDSATLERLASTAEQRTLLRQIDENFADYMSQGKNVLALSDEGKEQEAIAMLKQVMMKRAEALRTAGAELTDITKNATEAAYQRVQADFSTAFILTITCIAGLLAMIGGAVWFVAASVARPIETITSAMRGLAAGNSATPIPFAERSDEIGDMAEAVEVFRRNAIENARLESEASERKAAEDRDREHRLHEQAARTAAMEQATTGLGNGLRHLAGGDLQFRLQDAFAADFERLRTDFNSAADTLRTTLTDVARATGSIDGGSAEISTGVDDLSRRTEQQAAALEETAAALDQITANVAQSAKRAEEARTAAQKASESTDRSGTIVAEAVDAMIKIEQSSEQIAGIIGVIDEIAFQTNLLALNAGVEAARAGEAGKGFAVVAQEVRELAQRSATAAREIKVLIQRSTVDVESGVRLVKDTGEALRTIEGHVKVINTNMDAIATSAKEQSAGLLQVNMAVNQMDQVTQQNAAMVEETNAASASLASEANRLQGLVDRFSLGDAGRDAGSSSPETELAVRLAAAGNRLRQAAA
jgi:methyl-accepting chemotaxis protein